MTGKGFTHIPLQDMVRNGTGNNKRLGDGLWMHNTKVCKHEGQTKQEKTNYIVDQLLSVPLIMNSKKRCKIETAPFTSRFQGRLPLI